jgi:hypothetical protein
MSLPMAYVLDFDIHFRKYKRFWSLLKSIITGKGSDSFKRMMADNAFVL